MQVLLIEDTVTLASTLIRYLAKEEIMTTLCTDGESGYLEAINKNYDGIILDIALPKLSGIEICRKLRSE